MTLLIVKVADPGLVVSKLIKQCCSLCKPTLYHLKQQTNTKTDTKFIRWTLLNSSLFKYLLISPKVMVVNSKE